jgi:hypothetical protein
MGMNLQMGGGFGSAWPGTAGTSANASPQGPATAAQAAFGVQAGQGAGSLDGKTTAVLSVGTLAFLALAYIWWALPR